MSRVAGGVRPVGGAAAAVQRRMLALVAVAVLKR
jgi:hypothetical protein